MEENTNLQPIAVKATSAFSGLQIYSITSDEVVWGYQNDPETYMATVEYAEDEETGEVKPYFLDINNDKQYLEDFMRVESSNDSGDKNAKVDIYEALTDEDVQLLSGLQLTDDEMSIVLNMFEFVSEENKNDMIQLINLLLAGKQLVPVISTDSEADYSASERYTSMLLNGGKQQL